MPIELEDAASSNTGNLKRKKPRSVVGRVFRGIGRLSAGPVDWLGVRSISRGASLIRGLSITLRAGTRRNPRFGTSEYGGFELEAPALLHDISVFELDRQLKLRRRQTARIAYTTFALACVFLVGWVCESLSSPLTTGRIVLALEFLPFCVLFFLVAFYNALLNFQIRVGHMASWREYLATSEPFWPR